MASLEDYDEFGNYIGADLESDEDDEIAQDPYISRAQEQEMSHAPLEGFDDERPQGADSLALMEVDGQSIYYACVCALVSYSELQNLLTTL